MGRSKFPGKPSKHVNKKRVNVLPCSVTRSNGTSTVYNVLSETSSANNTSLNTDQAIALSESDVQEAATHITRYEESQKDLRTKNDQDSKCTLLTSSSNVNKMTLKDCQINSEIQNSEYEKLGIFIRSNKSSTFLYNYTNYTIKNEAITKSVKNNKKLIKKPSDLAVSLKVTDESVKSNSCTLARRSLYTRRQAKRNSDKNTKSSVSPAASRLHEKDPANVMGKFVLPTRSLHSSRVIIPNKRFINHEQIHSTNNAECISKPNNRRVKVFEKSTSQCNKAKRGSDGESVKNKQVVESIKRQVVQNSDEINNLAENDTRSKSDNEPCSVNEVDINEYLSSLASDGSKDSSDMVVIDSSSDNNAPWSCGKLVLRKARLQLHTQSSEGMDGPFTSYSTSSANPPGTVTCGVCGAVRFYRFVKQARKFNIYSCESCRKFISKMIKRQTCSKTCSMPTLVCHKGQGMCHVPPIVRSQQWKLIRCAYKARCPACWLKMCLRSFQMPSQLKNSLISMLPENMRSYTDPNCSALSDITQPRKPYNASTQMDWHLKKLDTTNTSSKSLLQETSNKISETYSPVKFDVASTKSDPVSNSKGKKQQKTRLMVRKKRVVVSNDIAPSVLPDIRKRQKLDLKGPRVKHVCRSASIVLGQPIATFPTESCTDTVKKKIAKCDTSSEIDACATCNLLPTEVEPLENIGERNELCDTTNETHHTESHSGFVALSPKSSCTAMSHNITVSQEAQSQSELSKNVTEIQLNGNSDCYELEDKIFSTGFGLIGSEPFSIQAVCFYCGSTGQNELIYCACCCESYHLYCTNERFIYNNIHEVTGSSAGSDSYSILKYSWTCPRCSICHRCSGTDKLKFPCQICKKYFHSNCMKPDMKDINMSMICSGCLHCENCGSKNVTNLIGNLNLCSSCCNLKKRIISCMHCKKNDIDVQSKMLKCNKCEGLVHVECEELSDEEYHILSYLPTSFKFVCRWCSSTGRSSWREDVNRTLKIGYHIVLRSLTKDRTARELMNWHIKFRTCSCILDNSSRNIFSHDIQNGFTSNVQHSKAGFENCLEALPKALKTDSNTECVEQKSDFNVSSKILRRKNLAKDCSISIKNCSESKDKSGYSWKILNNKCDPSTYAMAEEQIERKNKGYCEKHDCLSLVSLLNIKKKIDSNAYETIKEFHLDVEQAFQKIFSDVFSKILNSIMIEIFPWYDPVFSQKNYVSSEVMLDSNKMRHNNVYSCDNPIRESTANVLSCKYDEHVDITDRLDTRICVLCKGRADGNANLEGRLLYCGQNDWIHINCAFWSANVYESIDCSLQNVQQVITRSRLIQCTRCNLFGATVTCSAKCCNEIFHYPCARSNNCFFLSDKTVFCVMHYDLAPLKTTVVTGREFEIQRPVYVESYKKKVTNNFELPKVKFMIGSLSVTNLGTFIPPLSDTEEAIIPTDFVCSRLFWSVVEPWKIVKYKITTTVVVQTFKIVDDSKVNFTVDHSLSQDDIQKKIMEISNWNKELQNEIIEQDIPSAMLDDKKEFVNITDDEKVISQVLEYVLELICNKEVEDNCDDEPQNTADLLPPELKDAIFEDLPHDLLDGISMQDIFPKLMSYEDVISMDLKTSDVTENNDILKDTKTDLPTDTVADINSYEFSPYKGRKTDFYVTENDLWLEPKYSLQGLDSYIQNGKISSGVNVQELRRSKSEVFSGIKKLTRTRNHQRSCSLTWSCKLDSPRTTNIKKRKVSCTSKSVTDISSNLFMVVDGTDDKGGSMLQELRLPDGVLMTVGRSTNGDCISDTVRELKYRLEENSVLSSDRFKSQNPEIEQGKENKCRAWQKKPQSRIMQVDGADDMSSSASDNETTQDDSKSSVKNLRRQSIGSTKTSDEPVKCDRCQCTYRTHSSYKRHLASCDFITTSESDSDISLENEKITKRSASIAEDVIKNGTSKVKLGYTLSPGKTMEHFVLNTNDKISFTSTDTHVTTDNQLAVIFPNVNKTRNNVNEVQSEVISQNIQTKNSVISINDLMSCPQTVTLSPLHLSTDGSQGDSSVQFIQNNTVAASTMHGNNQVIINNSSVMPSGVITTTQNTNVVNLPVLSDNVPICPKSSMLKVAPIHKQIVNKPKNNRSRVNTNVTRGKSKAIKTVTAKRTILDKSMNIITHSSNAINHASNPVRLPAVQNGTSGPTVIIQHLSSPNLMPAYVEAFQHQTGQNLQCIATIVPNEYKPSSYMATNSIVPGTFHMQSTESTNLISLPNGDLSVLPGLQIGPQSQSTVLGTLIQQSRPTATLQCGVMATEQLLLGSVPTVDTIMTDSSGSMYFTTQPMYYGFETIVQNTVMSSQQFMSTALPGVLTSNSSYSATTTQVFQAGKIEPVVDMNGTSYVLVNSTVPQVPPSIPVSPYPTLASVYNRSANVITPQKTIPDIHATYPVQIAPVTEPIAPTIEPALFSDTFKPVSEPPIVPAAKSNNVELTSHNCSKAASGNEIIISSLQANNSITLPVAPYASDNGIPMNIVNPIPQVTTNSSTLVSRPMNRVLPMQTAPPQRESQKEHSPMNKMLSLEPPAILNKLSETVEKIQETLNNDVETTQSVKLSANDSQLLKLESASLKLVFQKQSQDGVYKISNKYISKNNMPIQITPMKQTKAKILDTMFNAKNNTQTEKKTNTSQEKLMNKSRERTQKTSNILYKIQSQDGFDYSSTSITELWKKVFEAVQSARAVHNMPLLPENAFNSINGLELLGLNTNGLRYLTEQLPGVTKCIKYKPVIRKNTKSLDAEEHVDIIETCRAARCESYNFNKEPYDMFSWLASRHRNPDYVPAMDIEQASRRQSSVNLPMAMRFRQLKETSKHAVGVYRSSIHGRGLFCLRDIECGEMVIEYAGEVIRSTLTDKREKYYNSKGIGCYMFRVDDNLVIDATMRGNAARFINHSCDPNCYSRVLDILGHKHILIFALRKILQGEELTYDYKFPFEEDKIPCTCGSKRCRKYLN